MTSRSRPCKNHPDSFCYICNGFKIADGKKFTQSLLKKLIAPILAYNLVIRQTMGSICSLLKLC